MYKNAIKIRMIISFHIKVVLKKHLLAAFTSFNHIFSIYKQLIISYFMLYLQFETYISYLWRFYVFKCKIVT